MPPVEPAQVPMPTTDPTALLGNMSEVVVKRFADHPWWAAVARLSRPMATHSELNLPATKMGTTAQAQTSIAVSRAPAGVRPSLRTGTGSQPPQILPTEDVV